VHAGGGACEGGEAIDERIEAEIAQAERAESAIARARSIAEGGRFKVAANRRRRPAA
jgi:hypothetical protein